MVLSCTVLVCLAVILIMPNVVLFATADNIWPSFMHDSSHSSLSQYAGTTNSTLWHFNVRNGTSALIVGQNNTIYFGSWGALVALDSNHTEKFKLNVGGIVDPPLVGQDGTIYFENGNTLFAATQDGVIKWKFQSNDTLTVPASDEHGQIYVGSGNLVDSINPDGTLLWSYKTNGTASMPSIGPDGIIYVGNTDHSFYAIDAGSLKWKFDAKGITTAASVSPLGVVYFCDSDKHLYALDSNGTMKWTYATTNTGSPPAIGPDGVIFLADGTGIVALNSAGIENWNFHVANSTVQSISVDKNGTIYAGTFENKLYALDSGGNVKWAFDSHGSVGEPVIADGIVYFNNGEGMIYALGQPIPEFPVGAILILVLVAAFGIFLTSSGRLRYDKV